MNILKNQIKGVLESEKKNKTLVGPSSGSFAALLRLYASQSREPGAGQ